MPPSRFLLLGILAALSPSLPAAELKLTSPIDYQVIQRTPTNDAKIPISAEISGIDPAEANFEVRVEINGKGEWRPLPVSRKSVALLCDVTAPAGGWYSLQIRLKVHDQTLAEQTVPHVGVGEVFIVAGQSNSANYGEEKQTTQTQRVATFDGHHWQLANDPQPGAGGQKGSFMPPLGDALAERFHVPIGFIPCGIGGTSIREWLPAGSTFPNPPTIESRVRQLPGGEWESKGDAFTRLVERMKQPGPHGFRAVLWHQGESDANQKDPTRTLPGPLYSEYLKKIIRESRHEIGWDAPWFVAQASYHTPTDPGSPEIRTAQESLWHDHTALQGPDTDAIKPELRENNGKGVHFSGAGLREHAARWFDKIAPWLQAELQPAP